jgi:hypothetical protein
MEEAAEATAGGKGRSGSETRQKGLHISVRVTAAEHADIAEAANKAGVSMGGYVRDRVLVAPPTTRARHRPSIEVSAITRLQSELNKVGGNIHQLLKRVNFGETPLSDEIRAAFTGYRETNVAILETLRAYGK